MADIAVSGKKSTKNVVWTKKPLSKPKAKVRVGTLFSGIGAAEHALQRLKLKTEIVFAGDIDPHVKQSYFKNYKITEDRWHDDVNDFDARPFKGKVDLVIGGAPCQSFSMVGKRGGLEDIRGTLVFQFIRVVEECAPKVFIFENVRGLLSQDDGKSWIKIQQKFEKLGYVIKYDVLNSKDYGVPQNRQRLFVIGFKNKRTNFSFPEPIPLKLEMKDLLEDSHDEDMYLREKGVKFVTSSKNRQKRYTQINGQFALCQKRNQQSNWHGDFVFEFVDKPEKNPLKHDEFLFKVADVEEKYFLSEQVRNYVLATGTKTFKTRPETDLPVARPLLQSMHKMHRAGVDNYITEPLGKIRKLTPRECLRLMGFRDTFDICVSNTQMYRQTGNSIVVDVLMAIFKQMDISKYGVTDAHRK